MARGQAAGGPPPADVNDVARATRLGSLIGRVFTRSGAGTSGAGVRHRNVSGGYKAALPIPPRAPYTRGAWLIMISPWGVRNRATLPIDNRRDRPEPAAIVGLCDLIALLIARSGLVTDDETALVVLKRPGTARVSDADRHIFRLLCEATARRDTIRWAFYVVTPPGIQKLGCQA